MCAYFIRRSTDHPNIQSFPTRRSSDLKPQYTAENVLDRAFDVDYEAMEVLLTDITEFKYGRNSKAYFSAILDYGENKIIAYKLRSEEHTSELQSRFEIVCRLLLEKNKT